MPHTDTKIIVKIYFSLSFNSTGMVKRPSVFSSQRALSVVVTWLFADSVTISFVVCIMYLNLEDFSPKSFNTLSTVAFIPGSDCDRIWS